VVFPHAAAKITVSPFVGAVKPVQFRASLQLPLPPVKVLVAADAVNGSSAARMIAMIEAFSFFIGEIFLLSVTFILHRRKFIKPDYLQGLRIF
jgi:hypothetical protein